MTFTENELKTAEGILWIKRSNCTDKERDLSIALDIAMKVLKKQIAKKPIDKVMYIECPTCGDVGIEDCAYCPVCGQKLDWSEV